MGRKASAIIAFVGFWAVYGPAVFYFHCDILQTCVLLIAGFLVGALAVEAGH